MSSQDSNNNQYLLSLFAAVTQQQEQQRQFQELLREHQHRLWSTAASAVAVSAEALSASYMQNLSGHQAQHAQQAQMLPQHFIQSSNASPPCPLRSGQLPYTHLQRDQVSSRSPRLDLLAKLRAVASNSQARSSACALDSNMVELLDTLYLIEDQPEPDDIEMLSKRLDVPSQLVADWFANKRKELCPLAGAWSPQCYKRREGGRVITFSEYQRSLMEAIFGENNYLHPHEYEELSELLQVPSRNIRVWFKNRRSKQRLSGNPVRL